MTSVRGMKKKHSTIVFSPLARVFGVCNIAIMIMLNDNYYSYITTNKRRTVLYVGVTNDLGERMIEHYQNQGTQKSFTGSYNCNILVYYEGYEFILDAIAREKQLKKWSRKKKDDLITGINPKWENLYLKIFGSWPPVKLLRHHR